MKPETREELLGIHAQDKLDGIPLATYRLQFSRDFTFRDATELVPYLHSLGISHCYASPYLKARAGSSHGYDIVDHNALNPEIGAWSEFETFISALRARGMAHILDIVPNHMGVGGDDDVWWLDVLENGQASPYARFFDIDWHPIKEELRGKVLLPLLGDHYGKILETGELRLEFDDQAGEFSVRYFEHRFPIDPRTYSLLLKNELPVLENKLGRANPALIEYESLISAFQHLPLKRDIAADKREERARDKELLKQRLAHLAQASEPIHTHIDRVLAGFTGEKGFEPLHRLLERQAYRLAYWRVASDEVNYRRFFDINSLAGLRTERPEVFRATHGLILGLIAEGKLHGLRIDHPDGLYDPAGYYERLRSAIENTNHDRPFYIVAEKILAPYEHLREDWPVNGTTGYEFANLVNGLFIDPASERALTRLYERFTGRSSDFDALLYERKLVIIKFVLASELAVLANLANQISEADWRTRDFTANALRDAIIEVVACFPVYRTYVRPGHVTSDDRRYVGWAIAQAKKRSFAVDLSIFDFLEHLLLLESLDETSDTMRPLIVDFALKFQQYTAPVMAKGLEDTAFYIYNRLVSLNEVGGDPRRFATSLAAFHHANLERLRRWPHTLLSTSTHDTKRSEDVRARINVLSEVPREWSLHLRRWVRINAPKKRRMDHAPAPDRNDEYLLYQTLVGTWPANETDQTGIDLAKLDEYVGRIQEYMLKAVREAKIHSSWINPNAEYEQALRTFIENLFGYPTRNRFLSDFLPFVREIARAGALNSLSQTLLKLTAPGVPDVYQGNDLFDFSLVDPDNRRPVDYNTRRDLLAAMPREPTAESARALLGQLHSGAAKLYLVHQALRLRALLPALFKVGGYEPLAAHGPRAQHLCAFSRNLGADFAVTIAPRWFLHLLRDDQALPPGSAWNGTVVDAPVAGAYRNVLTGEIVRSKNHNDGMGWQVAAVLKTFPVALLVVHPGG